MVTIRISDTTSLTKKRKVNTSSGCYLVHKDGNRYELLLIKKTWPNGKIRYVLPKGHREGKETLEETAIRETEEETGYRDIELISYLGSSTYELDMEEILIKTDHYFLALLVSDEQSDRKPETYEEDVMVENLWFELDEGMRLLTFENHPEILDLIKQFI